MDESPPAWGPSLRRSRMTLYFTRSGPMPDGSLQASSSSLTEESTSPRCRTRAVSSRNSVGVSSTAAPATSTVWLTKLTCTWPSSKTPGSGAAACCLRSRACTRAVNSALPNGLVRESSAPPRRPRTLSASWPCEVSMSTGTSLSSRIRSSTVHPSISGSPTSRITMSGCSLWKTRSPSRPSVAVVTSNPFLPSTVLTPSAMSGSSSITSTRSLTALQNSLCRAGSRGCHRRADGEEHAERGALVAHALHLHVPAVHLDKRLDDGKPESGAWQARDPRVGSTDERAEQPRRLIGRYADPRVGDVDAPGAAHVPQPDPHQPVHVGELDRVADQVVENLG